jgi:predicted dehydrogenase
MILVLGGGFGLYGHLPALVAAGKEVAAPARYRSLAEARPELTAIIGQVAWIEDERDAGSRATTVILARRPNDNAELARWALAGGTEARLVIEKPVAPSWREADTLEAALVAKGRRWAVPYLFLHCDWFQLVTAAVREGRSVRIVWTHSQSSGLRGWKKAEAEGGGAASFYFIHMLALIEALLPGAAPSFNRRYDHGGERIKADMGSLAIVFRLDGALRFNITIDDRTLVDDLSPFGPLPLAGAKDPRIPMLRRFYADVDGPAARGVDFYRAVTRHWGRLEEAL